MYNSKGPTGKNSVKSKGSVSSKTPMFAKNDKMDMLKASKKPKGKKK